MATLQKISNALFIYVLCGVLLAAFVYQFMRLEDLCPLCYMQRLGIVGIAIGLLMNLRFGIKTEHYGLCMLSALLGNAISLYQISLHICPQSPTFGEPIFGFDLYVWASIVFTCSMFAIAILLMLFGFSHHQTGKPLWGAWETAAFTLVAIILLANILTTLIQCGLSPCPA